MKYFKNVKSLEDLKSQFKALARKNHPDAGGNIETMKEINCEYDALFPIWKDRQNTAAKTEAEKTRQHPPPVLHRMGMGRKPLQFQHEHHRNFQGNQNLLHGKISNLEIFCHIKIFCWRIVY